MALVALALVLASCAPSRRAPRPGVPTGPVAAALHAFAPAPESQRLIDPRPSATGLDWLGGDVASSAEVGKGRWVWIFGDTLLGRVGETCSEEDFSHGCEVAAESIRTMIPNSVGVMTRGEDGSLAPIVKYWRTVDGAPAPIFAAADPAEILWPLALVSVDDVLLVAASRHTRASGVRSLGSVLVRVVNPHAPPDQWVYTLHPVPHVILEADAAGVSGDGAPLTWSTALVHDGDFVYLLGRRGTDQTARTVLARLTVKGIGARRWHPALRYLVRGPGRHPVWSAAFDASRLHEIEGLPGTSEAALVFDRALGWYTYQIPWLARGIHLYTAPRLAGPWWDEGVVYEIPAPRPPASAPCASVEPGERGIADDGNELEAGGAAGLRYFAYAAKPHPELAPPGGYALSYNLNVLGGSLRATICAVEHVRGVYVPQLLSAPARSRWSQGTSRLCPPAAVACRGTLVRRSHSTTGRCRGGAFSRAF